MTSSRATLGFFLWVVVPFLWFPQNSIERWVCGRVGLRRPVITLIGNSRALEEVIPPILRTGGVGFALANIPPPDPSITSVIQEIDPRAGRWGDEETMPAFREWSGDIRVKLH